MQYWYCCWQEYGDIFSCDYSVTLHSRHLHCALGRSQQQTQILGQNTPGRPTLQHIPIRSWSIMTLDMDDKYSALYWQIKQNISTQVTTDMNCNCKCTHGHAFRANNVQFRAEGHADPCRAWAERSGANIHTHTWSATASPLITHNQKHNFCTLWW